MSKYIDADKLIAEIERQKKHSQDAKIEFINEGYNQNAFAEDCRLTSFDKLLSFITSLQQEQPAEWSEEDEKQLNDIIRLLPGLDIRHSWLKHIKDKVQSTHHWKPSEEQMEALKSYAEDSACLNELYDDLKKL